MHNEENDGLYIEFKKHCASKNLGPGPVFEKIITRVYTDHISTGDHVIDGGANIGFHTLCLTKLVGPDGLVYAFEPIPQIAKKLRARLSRQGLRNYKVYELAISDKLEKTNFHHVKNAPAYSGINKRPYPPHVQDSLDIEIITTICNKIDNICYGDRKISFFKLDLEGGEFRALQGAKRVLRTNRPIVAFENGRVVPSRSYGYSKEEFFAFFTEIGYGIYDIFCYDFTIRDWRNPNVPFYFWAIPAEKVSLLNLIGSKVSEVLRKDGFSRYGGYIS